MNNIIKGLLKKAGMKTIYKIEMQDFFIFTPCSVDSDDEILIDPIKRQKVIEVLERELERLKNDHRND